jgi:sugar phosphate isomerase/epimerase
MKKPWSRRSFMSTCAGGYAAALMGRAGAAASSFLERTGIRLGVQLYTLGEDIERDLDGTLAALEHIGYRQVEMAGFLGRSASVLRRAFDRAGLACPSAHIPISAATGEFSLEQADRVLEDAQTLGWRYVIVPSLPSAPGVTLREDDWQSWAERLNEIGARLARANLALGYHNHNAEFAPLNGTTGYQILLERTHPDLVTFEMDAGWVAAAGWDPDSLLKRYPKRFRLMHVKDVTKNTRANFSTHMESTPIGSGAMNWSGLFRAAYAAGVREFFVEQEPPFSTSRLDALAQSYRYLAQIP